MIRSLLLSFLFVLVTGNINAQVKIGSTGTPNVNAVLELDGGTSKGLLLPKLSFTEITALTIAPDGLMVYNKTDNFLYIRKGAAWQKISDATSAGGGGFTLPYSGTASTLGGAEFSIAHTTTFGDAVYFTNTTGAALTTGGGNNKLNMINGNTGIGLPAGLSDNPTLGKLVVRGTVGAVSAMFGDNTSGVSVMNNFPSVGFNYYYNGGSKAISTGFGSALGQDPATGRIYLSSSATIISGAGTAMPLVDRLVVLANGNTGIAAANPLATLQVGRGSTIGGTAQFDGTTYSSHFNYNSTEETYIRGGKATSQVIINDLGTGNIRLAENGGNVGIGITVPANKLSVAANSADDAVKFYNAGTGDAVYALSSNGSAINAVAFNVNVPAIKVGGGSASIITDGNIGVGNSNPHFPVDVKGRMRLRHIGSSNTAGIWFDGTTDTLRSFIGTNNNNSMGFYGGLSGWSFLMDVNDGTLMIGTTQKAAGYRVNVGGKIIAEEVRVQLRAAWPDYVFDDNYQKLSIDSLSKFLADHKHLPNMPSAKEVEKNGQQLGELQRKMMEKIEELTLYIVEVNKRVAALEQENKLLKQ